MSIKVNVWKILGLLLIAFYVLSAVKLVGATSTLSPTTTIPNISGSMTYDSGKGEIFVQYGSYANCNVSVISDSTNQVIANLTTGETSGYNGGLVYDSGKGEIFAASGNAYVAGGPTPTLTVISDSNNTVVATITYATFGNSAYDFPYQPKEMAYDPGKGEIFIADPGSGYHPGNVYIMSDSSNTVFTYIGLAQGGGSNPGQLVYDSGMGEIFVANTGSNTVSVISDSNNTVVANVTVGSSPYGVAYDPSKGEIFVYNEGDGTVSVISDNSNTVVANITGIAVQSNYLSTIAYDSGKGMVLAGNAVISDSTDAVVAQLPANTGNLVYDSGKGETFAATGSALSVFTDSTVPEFGSTSIFAVATAMTAMTACAVIIVRRNRHR